MSLDVSLTAELFSGNITHNLSTMAKAAGLYRALWRPDEIPASSAGDLIIPLDRGLSVLLSNPKEFQKLNPSNGWGDYEGLVRFVTEYLEACRKFPHAMVSACR